MQYIFLSQLIFSGTNLLVGLYFGRNLSFEQLSIIAPIFIFLNIFLASSNTHSDKYIYYLLSKRRDIPYRAIFAFDFIFAICIFIVISMIVFWLNLFPHPAYLLLLFAALVYNATLRLRIPAEVTNRLLASRRPMIIAGGVTAIALAVVFFVGATEPINYVLLRVAPYPLEMLLLLLFFVNVFKIGAKAPFYSREMVKFSGPYFLSAIIVLAYGNLDYLAIGYYLSQEDLGIYFFIFQFYAQFLILRKIVLSYIYPKFVANPNSSFDDAWVMRWFLIVTAAIITLLILHTILLDTLVRIFLGTKWSEYLVIFFVNSCILFEKIVFSISEPYYSLRNRTERIIQTTVLNLLIMVLLILLLQNNLSILLVSLTSFTAFYVSNNIVFMFAVDGKKRNALLLALLRLLAYSAGYLYVANL